MDQMSTKRRLLPSTSALAAFDAVARLGSFTAAARDLNLTQGAISRQISALEALLGRDLVIRTSRRVELTEAGALYAQEVAAALGQIRGASLRLMSGAHAGALMIAILPTFGTRWLMPRIPRFVESHPAITLSFATRIGKFDFAAEGIDAAIHNGQPDWPDAQSTFLMREQIAPVYSPAFADAHGIRDMADMAHVPLLHMASRPDAWENWFERHRIDARPAGGMLFEHFATVAQAAIAGLGAALLPLFLIGSELERGQLVTGPGEPVEDGNGYYFVAPAAKAASPPVAAFRDWLLSETGGES